MTRVTMSALLAVGALTISQIACGGESSKAETRAAAAPATSVLGPNDVATVEKTDIVEGIPVSGTLEPAVDVRIASPIPEVIEAVMVNEGEAVKKGQPLARFQTGVLGPQATSAEAQSRIAAHDFERMKNLFAEG